MVRDLALFAARQALGHGMAAHGAQKALGWFEGPGPAGAAAMMEGLGFRPGATYARAAAWNELVAGELIALGLGGPLGPAMLISTMIVAQTSVHWPNGFFAQKGGIELGLVYGAAALALASGDYGAISLDAVFGLREPLRRPDLTALALVGGVAAALLILGRRSPAPPEDPATPAFRGKNSPLPEPERD
jgi:putative oxidoreductase